MKEMAIHEGGWGGKDRGGGEKNEKKKERLLF